MNAVVAEILLLAMLVPLSVGALAFHVQRADLESDALAHKLRDPRTTVRYTDPEHVEVCAPLWENPSSPISCTIVVAILVRDIDPSFLPDVE